MLSPCVRPGPSPPHLEGVVGRARATRRRRAVPAAECCRPPPRAPSTQGGAAQGAAGDAAVPQRSEGAGLAGRAGRRDRAREVRHYCPTPPHLERITLGAKEPTATGDIVNDYV
jgi:hypothetical protein